MEIINSTPADISGIFRLYDLATEHMKTVAEKHWKGFQRPLIEQEINEQRQYKIVMDGSIACIFTLSYQDPFIWGEKNSDPAIYLHRIATNPDFRGQFFVKKIVAWAKQHAVTNHKHFIRMDTGSGNEKLNNYYVSCGFTYLGVVEIADGDGLPEHYKNGTSSLFEIRL